MTHSKLTSLPAHVLRPGRTSDYDGADEHTKRAGLGYAILRALGAHERLSPVAMSTIAKWSAEYGAAHGGVTPDPRALRGQDFEQRVGRAWGADKAASNAARYPGGHGGRPSYARVFEDVWGDRLWPELCEALGSAR